MKAKNKRERIIEISIRLINEKGYRGTTIQDIANELNFTKAAFYYHLKSKEDLLIEILRKVQSLSQFNLDEVGIQDASPRKLIEDLISRYLSVLLGYQEIYSIYLQERNRPFLKENREFIEGESIFSKKFQKIIGKILEGQSIKDLDPKLVSLAVIGMCNWTFNWYRKNGLKTPQEIANQFVRIICDGILTGE